MGLLFTIDEGLDRVKLGVYMKKTSRVQVFFVQ